MERLKTSLSCPAASVSVSFSPVQEDAAPHAVEPSGSVFSSASSEKWSQQLEASHRIVRRFDASLQQSHRCRRAKEQNVVGNVGPAAASDAMIRSVEPLLRRSAEIRQQRKRLLDEFISRR